MHIIIDGNNLVYRAWKAKHVNLYTNDNTPTGIVHVVFSSLVGLMVKWSPRRTMIVWDSRSAYRQRVIDQYREQLPPELRAALPQQYKERRRKVQSATQDEFRTIVLPQLRLIEQHIADWGVDTFRISGVEGDDIIGVLTDIIRTSAPDSRILIVSTDKDLYQLLDPQTMLYDPVKKSLYTDSDFTSEFKMPPARWPELRALIGDASDSIPGVPGIGIVRAIRLLANTSIVDLVAQTQTDANAQKTRIHTAIRDHAALIRCAYELSCILTREDFTDTEHAALSEQLRQWETPQAPIRLDAVAEFCRRYELQSVYKKFLKYVSAQHSLDIHTTVVKDDPKTDAQIFNTATTLSELYDRWGDCRRCPLAQTRTQLVRWSGPAHAPIVLVGEAPGAAEDIHGVPFIGRAGQYLERELMHRHGIDRSRVHITNAVCCRPVTACGANRPPTIHELGACRPRLCAHIRLVNPRLLVLVGDKALRAVLSTTTEKISDIRGKLLSAPDFPQIPIIATYHPSYLMRLQQTHTHVLKAHKDWDMIAEFLHNTVATDTPNEST